MDMSKQLKYSLIALGSAIVFIIVIIIGYSMSDEPTSTVPEVSTNMNVQQGFDAVHRDMPFVDHVCYDKIQGFLVHVAKDQTSQSGLVLVVGWQANSTLKFYRMENNTWFIGNWSVADFVQIAPDITGIQCQQFVPDLT